MSKLRKLAANNVTVNELANELTNAINSLDKVESLWNEIENSNDEVTKDIIAGSYEYEIPFRQLLTQLKNWNNNINVKKEN